MTLTPFSSLLKQLKSHLGKITTLLALACLFLTLPSKNPILSLSFHLQDKGYRDTKLQLPPPPPVPIKNPDTADPEISATAAIIIDYDSSSILYQKNPDLPLLPASTTKIMTALIALETYPLDQVITITKEDRSIGNTMNLAHGEQITVQDLLYGTLVASGNDAALALALPYPDGGYTGFIKAMNKKAQQLNLNNTSFKNVSGVESPGHATTVRDLSLLTQYALKQPTFKHIVATKQITVTSKDQQITHSLHNTNQLLGTLEGVSGVKTGWTEKAGECLVTSTERGGHTIITAILHSPDRFAETETLINWAFTTYTWTDIKHD